jgi:4-amino-4-deoxy-L-arabinose transferase-like glycosyltransferase
MNSILKPRIFFALEILLLLSIIFVVLLPLSPSDQSLPSRDSGVFLYAGWRVLHGAIPYLQIWDHKTPVIYYLDAIGLWLTPDSTWGVWLVEVVSLGVATLAGYLLLKKLYGLFPAIFISFLWLFSAFYLMAGGNLTTEYALPFQFLLLWLFYKAENQPKYGWYGMALGAITSLLFFTRQNAIAIPLAIGIYLLVSRIYQRKFRSLLNDSVAILVGGLVMTGIIVGYYASKGALNAFWETAFIYNFAYVDEKVTADRFNALIQGLNQLENVGMVQIAFLGWAAALALLCFKKERIQVMSHPVLWMVVIALPLELWLVSIGGRPRIPYFLVLLPVLSILAGFTIWLVFDSLLKDIPLYAGAIILLILVFSLGSVFSADYLEILSSLAQPSGDSAIVSYIQNNSAPSDFVLMWGAEAAYNFAARRASPTRFVYQTPLYNEKNKLIVKEFLQDILKNKPKLIVLRSDDRFSDIRFGYRDDQTSNLMDQVKGLYGTVNPVGDWKVYQYTGQ